MSKVRHGAEVKSILGVMLADICNQLTYHRLDISISPETDVTIHGWLGAVIRNNLLYAAENVRTPEGISLLALLDRFPVTEQHPLYSVLKGGFPKFFAISVLSPEGVLSSRWLLSRAEEVDVYLSLIGSAGRYYREFIEAVRMKSRQGLGKPRTPFRLNEIREKDGLGRENRIAVGHMEKVAPLRFPVSPEDFREEKFGEKEKVIQLLFRSPLLLTVMTRKKDSALSYQDKMNGFPSFYQFVRSAFFRCLRLTALYVCPEEGERYTEALAEMDALLEESTAALLMKADIRWVRIPGPPRDGERSPMLFSGYVGELVFVGDFSRYLPLLSFMQTLGNGNDTVYGLGHYQVNVLEYTRE